MIKTRAHSHSGKKTMALRGRVSRGRDAGRFSAQQVGRASQTKQVAEDGYPAAGGDVTPKHFRTYYLRFGITIKACMCNVRES